MPVGLDDFLEEFDEVSDRVARARHEDFARVLRRWFAVFEEAPEAVAARVRWLMDIHPWVQNEATLTKENSGMGNSQLLWPDNREQRLSAQLTLFKELAEERIEAWNFAFEYFSTSSNNINDTLHQMTEHLFEPHVAELRRYLIRNAENPPGDNVFRIGDFVPASDRIVPLDHNSPAHVAADAALAAVEEKLEQANDGDPEEKHRVIAEVSAARRLLQATRVRTGALVAVLSGALAWVATQFAETAAGQAAEWAIQKVIEYLPMLKGLF